MGPVISRIFKILNSVRCRIPLRDQRALRHETYCLRNTSAQRRIFLFIKTKLQSMSDIHTEHRELPLFSRSSVLSVVFHTKK